jgi:EAL domain-containing protein (putative c-di-GMP-specific phosphodiesterase class I)
MRKWASTVIELSRASAPSRSKVVSVRLIGWVGHLRGVRVQAVAWLRGHREGEMGTAPRGRGAGPAAAEWFGEGSAFQSDRELAAALIRMAGTHSADGTPIGLTVPLPVRGRASRSSPAPISVAEAFHWLDEVLGPEDQAQARRRRLSDRVRAVIDGGVIPVFQPIVDLRSGRVAGVEALSRFVRGSPQQWFREAEDVGMRELLEAAAIRAAIAALPGVPEEVYLALNISPSTLLRPEMPRLLRSASLSRIVIEVTEAAMTLDHPTVSRALKPLREAGARIAVDDAGSSNASLRQLLLLHPDIIKIDTSLTRGIQHGRARRALSGALVAFARETGSTVVAEGIENEAELEAVRECGVTHGQGFHLGRPAAPPLDLDAVMAGVAHHGGHAVAELGLRAGAA